MAIAIRSITTATNNGSSATISVTTSESPSATQVGDLVVVVHSNDFYTLAAMPTPTATGSPTLTNIVDADAGTNQGHIRCWWYVANTGGAQTVSVTETGAHDEEKFMAAYVLSGAATVSPIDGTPASNSSSTQQTSQVCNSVTVTNTDSYVIQALAAGSGVAAPSYTPPGGTTKQYDQNVGGGSHGGGIKQLSASGATGSFTWSVPPSGTPYASATFAIKTASAASNPTTAPTLVVRQVGQPQLARPIVAPPTIGPPQVIRLPQIAVVQNPQVRPGPAPFALTPPLLPAQAIPAAKIWVAPQAQPPPPQTVRLSAAQIIPPSTTILPLTVTVVVEQFRPAVVAPIVLTPPPLPQAAAPITVVQARPQPALAAVIALVPGPLPQAVAPVVVVTSTWRPRQPQVSLSQPGFAAPVTLVLAVVPTLVVPTFPFRPGPGPLVLTPALLPVGVQGVSGDGRIVTISTAERYAFGDADGRIASTTGQRVTVTDAAGRIVSTTEGGRL